MIGIAAIFGRNFQVGRQLPTFPELFGSAAECIDAGDQGLVFQSKQLIITGDYCMVKPSFARSQYCIDDIVYRRHPFGPMTSRANSQKLVQQNTGAILMSHTTLRHKECREQNVHLLKCIKKQ